MPDGEALEVRVARLEEQMEAARLEQHEARAARANLNDALQLMQVTLGALARDLAHMQTSLTEDVGRVRASCAEMQSNMTWLVRLVLGFIVLGLLGLLVSASTGHLR